MSNARDKSTTIRRAAARDASRARRERAELRRYADQRLREWAEDREQALEIAGGNISTMSSVISRLHERYYSAGTRGRPLALTDPDATPAERRRHRVTAMAPAKSEIGCRPTHDQHGNPLLTEPERAADMRGRALRIETLVHDLDPLWRAVVLAVYLHGRTVQDLAAEWDIERNRLMHRLHDAQERIGQALRAQGR